MPDSQAVTVNYIDQNGDKAHTSFYMKDTATEANIQSVVDALKDLSALEVVSHTVQKFYDDTDTAAATKAAGEPFADDKERLTLIWSSASARQNIEMGIPGPVAALITEDDQAVDPANALFDDLETAFSGAPGGGLGASNMNQGAVALLKGRKSQR